MPQTQLQTSGENDLRIAASKGELDRVTELYAANPELAESTDSRRRSALHLAASRGHIDVVNFLVSRCDLDMCIARDADGRNPLHLAAMNGKEEVLKVLIQKCPHAAEARAYRGETILHLWLKYNHKESLKSLLEITKLEKLINAKNDDGDTILHLVAADDQITASNLEMVKCLLACRKTDISAANAQGETALDILLEIDAKAKKNKTSSTKPGKTITELQVDVLRLRGAKRGEELGKIEWLAKKRDALMVVASLIAIMAFQAGVTPPGGVWQDNRDGHRAGETVMAYNYPDTYPYFLRLNTLGFVGSLSTILLLLTELPFKKKAFMWVLVVIIWGTITAMAFTYSFAITVITPVNARDPLSGTIKVGVIVWGSVMVVLLVIHTIKLIVTVTKEKTLKYFLLESKRRLGFRTDEDSISANGSIP